MNYIKRTNIFILFYYSFLTLESNSNFGENKLNQNVNGKYPLESWSNMIKRNKWSRKVVIDYPDIYIWQDVIGTVNITYQVYKLHIYTYTL